jgi:DNA-binding NtrC family response regulator
MPTAFKNLPGGFELIGQSPAFSSEIEKVALVAKHDASVLICGETGTGKELCAKAIHYLSHRGEKPFVAVNCGCIPTELVENELFGHSAGAFTSASASQVGLVHESDGGTLFLDEIATLPLSAQVKLLRFLQEKEYRPLGSTETREADVRMIAATNIDAEEAVRNGMLSRSLYYRICVVPIKLPPLRERREDIQLLARHFLAKYSARLNKNVRDFSSEAMRALVLYDWPGNVRELEHVIQRAIVLTHRAVIELGDIALPATDTTFEQRPFKEVKAEVVARFEKDFIRVLLRKHGGNISQAARAANKNRRAFWELIRKHGINVDVFKKTSDLSGLDNC